MEIEIMFNETSFKKLVRSFVGECCEGNRDKVDDVVQALWDYILGTPLKAQNIVYIIESLYFLDKADYDALDEEERLNCLWNDEKLYAMFE